MKRLFIIIYYRNNYFIILILIIQIVLILNLSIYTVKHDIDVRQGI